MKMKKTQASAVTFLSGPGQAFVDGMGFVQIYFGLPLAMVVVSAVMVPAYFRLKVYTAYQFLEERFDVRMRLLTAALFLILGEDNLAGFARWRAAEEIVALAQPIVVHRGELEAAAGVDELSTIARTRLAIGRLTTPALDASSTAIRTSLSRGGPALELVPPRLLEYIRAHGLYRAGP